MKIFENFSNVKVLVVGDVMIDRYWWGSVSRISPEAPVPVVRLEDMSLVAGGAANVASNIAGLGATPYLIGITGEDKEADIFPELLSKSNVSADYLLKIPGRQTTIKTRIIAHNQQVVRVDQETKEYVSPSVEAKLWEVIQNLLETVDIVVVSDYAKGVLTDKLLKRLITTANNTSKIILIDPKGKNFTKYHGATLLTPNQREAAEACNLEPTDIELIERAGEMLLESLSLEAILITQGEKGMKLFSRNQKVTNLNSVARQVYDVTGAGDTVIATLAVALSAGADLKKGAKIANTAAGLVVEQVGTTSISFDRLRQAFQNKNL